MNSSSQNLRTKLIRQSSVSLTIDLFVFSIEMSASRTLVPYSDSKFILDLGSSDSYIIQSVNYFSYYDTNPHESAALFQLKKFDPIVSGLLFQTASTVDFDFRLKFVFLIFSELFYFISSQIYSLWASVYNSSMQSCLFIFRNNY